MKATALCSASLNNYVVPVCNELETSIDELVDDFMCEGQVSIGQDHNGHGGATVYADAVFNKLSEDVESEQFHPLFALALNYKDLELGKAMRVMMKDEAAKQIEKVINKVRG